MWNRLIPSPNPCASTGLASLRGISDLCAPLHLFCTPTPLPDPVSSYSAFRKMGSMFFPMMSGSCLWPSPDFFHECPSLPCHSCSPPSCFWDFCFPHIPVFFCRWGCVSSSYPSPAKSMPFACHWTQHITYTASFSPIFCLFGLHRLHV